MEEEVASNAIMGHPTSSKVSDDLGMAPAGW